MDDESEGVEVGADPRLIKKAEVGAINAAARCDFRANKQSQQDQVQDRSTARAFTQNKVSLSGQF